ncbi:hypothetical protein Bsp3421_002671 [Burkholderia sp. FERM BP-3421]|uniref:hypothetical protein n=1 Tax=Burkholderia sp. FERM BP-3421 TaxID=1494466 RepID=UPI002362338F|nr:hypothetical protein [Burkholderia sp. FERM BP-3421]WDD92650.1 hypothetical protein Bsp3421_002671 [Burkholderia sp. FERM BP-3421]
MTAAACAVAAKPHAIAMPMESEIAVLARPDDFREKTFLVSSKRFISSHLMS